MNPITNSKIKEQIRLKYLQIAQNQESRINQKLLRDISQLNYDSKYELKPFIITGVIVGIVAWISLQSHYVVYLIVAIAVVIWAVLNNKISQFNEAIDEQKRILNEEAKKEIIEIYRLAEQNTLKEIAAYEQSVDKYCKKILNNASSMVDMVNNVTEMFQRMINHADSRSHVKFIEGTLIYTVVNDGIYYTYPSTYTNKIDDYNFNVARYRNLNAPAECEGLAQALAILTIKKMKKIYPPNSMSINVSHSDSQVEMIFRGANPNFVPARKII
jgi:hypothetical protein